MPSHFPLAFDKARHVGDGVAVVVADSREIAKDAAELVEVEYEPLDAVTDVGRALDPDAPLVHDDFETNECYVWKLDAGEVEQAFADAEVTVKRNYRQQRLIPVAMEPRGALAHEMPGTDELTLWTSTQIPHIVRLTLAGVVGIPEARLRVIAPDVGGGFGSKLDVYAEEALCLALARRLKKPVKWIEERSEAFNATIHGRDVLQEIELAATAEGKITAVRVRLVSAMGAYLQLVTPGIPLLGAWVYGGCYDIPAYSLECTGVFTHTTPTDAYRGAGRPEATYAIERAVDALAIELEMDPVELRRLNFITEFPATIASGLTIDSGDYNASLDRALEQLDLDAVRAEQAERRARGDTKELGIGLSTYVEMCGLAPSGILGAIRYVAGGWDAATIRCLPSGTVQVLTGTSPHGQGHETAWSQIAADELGYGVDEIEVLHGDTTVSPLGMDTYGSRSLTVGGIALHNAAQKIVAKARMLAAHQLQVPEDELDYEDGTFTAGDKSVTMKELAFAAWSAHDIPPGFEPGLEATAVYDPPNFSWPARRTRGRGRGRHRDRRRAAAALHRGRRRRQGREPDDRRRPDPRGHHAGGRAGPLRGGDLRRGRHAADLLAHELPRPLGGRAALVRARPDRDAEPDEPARRQGSGRDGHDRLAGGGDERRRKRPRAVRRHRHRHAGHSRAGVAGTGGGTAMIPATFDYEVAESAEHAVELLGSREDAKLLAGGHSLIPLMRLRFARPSLLVDIGRLDGLSYVRDAGEWLAIGALTRHKAIRDDPLVQEHFQIVSHTAGMIGDPQVRHRGTIGGSLAHCDPASDMPAVMLALDAEFVINGSDGERTVAAAEFFRGVFDSAVGPEEILTEIRLPKRGNWTGWSYLKYNRRAQDWATVGVAALVRHENGSDRSPTPGLRSRTWARRRCEQKRRSRRSSPAKAIPLPTWRTAPTRRTTRPRARSSARISPA